MYKRTVIEWTDAIVSYTKDGKRVKETEVRFHGIATDNKFELYKYANNKWGISKLYVHEVVKKYYWEE